MELIDLEGKLKLEYYKLQKTFQGEIALDEAKTVYVPAKHKGVKGMDEKTPLDEVIAKINEATLYQTFSISVICNYTI